MAAVARQRQQPEVILLGEERDPPRGYRAGAAQDQLVTQRSRQKAVITTCVAEIDLQGVLPRSLVPEICQPGGHPRRAPSRRDDQVGRERFLGALICAAEDPHPGNAPAIRCGRQPQSLGADRRL